MTDVRFQIIISPRLCASAVEKKSEKYIITRRYTEKHGDSKLIAYTVFTIFIVFTVFTVFIVFIVFTVFIVFNVFFQPAW